MHKARRLYLYLLSAISLEVLAIGLWLLLRVLLDTLGIGRGLAVGDGESDRQQLSLALALIGVGLPVWGVHWWLAERGLRAGAPRPDEERGSGVRALYLSAVLAVTLSVGIVGAAQLLSHLIRLVLGAPAASLTADDLPGSISLLLVAGPAWGYHVAIRRGDMEAGPMSGAAAWLPRLYLYGASLIALQLMLNGAADLIGLLGSVLAPPAGLVDDGSRSVQLASGLTTVVVMGLAWLAHWWYADRLIEDPGWRGTSERPSRLRLAYFVAVIGISATVVLVRLAGATSAILVPVFGATSALGASVTSGDLAREVCVGVAVAALWAIAWRLHLGWMRSEALRQDGSERARMAEQLHSYLVAAIGLAFGAVALAWLVGLTLDVLLGGSRTGAVEGFSRAELAFFVPMALGGASLWLWTWSRALVRYAADPVREAGSVVRRAYLLLALAASILTTVSSLGVVLYRLFGTLLGVSLSGDAVSELSTPIGFLVVAVAVAAYHGVAQRRDSSLRAAQPAEAPALQPGPMPAGPVLAQLLGRTLVLSGPSDANLDTAITQLRAQLPPGYRLEEG